MVTARELVSTICRRVWTLLPRRRPGVDADGRQPRARLVQGGQHRTGRPAASQVDRLVGIRGQVVPAGEHAAGEDQFEPLGGADMNPSPLLQHVEAALGALGSP